MNKSKEKLADDFVHMHYEYAKVLIKLSDMISSTGESGVLYKLYISNSSLSSGAIAKYLGLSSGRVANILKSLENKGYIIRKHNLKDKRVVNVSLTDEGSKQICNIYKCNKSIHMKIFENLGEKDINEFMKIMSKIFKCVNAGEY